MYLSKVKKSGIWFVYYRKLDGKKTRKSTGCKSKKDALKFLNDFERKINEKPNEKPIKLSEWKTRYLESIKVTHTPKSFRLAKASVDKFVKSMKEDILLTDINRAIAEKYILDYYQKSKYSASLQLRNLKAVFNRAIDNELIERNPFKGIKLRIPEKQPAIINEDQLNLILDCEQNEMFRVIYQFGFYSGMRRAEILNANWTDINLDSLEIYVRNKESFTTKTKKERVVPISKKLRIVLEEWFDKTGSNKYLFDNQGNVFDGGYISRQFKKAIRLVGVDDRIHFHSLRHSFASSLVQKGGSIYTIQKLLGHTQISTTQKYSHLSNDNLREAVNLLD